MRYFSEIFKSTSSSDNFFQRVQNRITEDMNCRLLRPFTHEEVKEALFEMAPDKAPGPDGMTPAFYQRFWKVVGHDLSCFILNCLHTCSIPNGLNDTNIVLIPKKKLPESVADLRPIALCKVAYKVLAKMLANRMKEVLDFVISPTQSAFVKNRLLSDNIIVAGEVGYYLRRTRQGNTGWAALKLDMAKAYDKMEWSFLEGMLTALGFAPAWIQLVLLCVTTIRYNVMVNGEPIGTVIPSRGIRQGDPLSPYLFIICAEGLSILLNQAESRGDIHGIRVARGAPSVSHLLFADDSLLFFKACEREVQVVKNSLDVYCAASGQTINYNKSNITFSANTPDAIKAHIATSLGVCLATDLGKYLGLPSCLGRSKSATLRFLEQRIRDRITGWRNKCISRAGKEILLKCIAQALPIFTMSMYLLPRNICDNLERLMNRFWWESGGTTSKGVSWLSWSRLCLPKCLGGMGFKKLHEFNLSLLAKQGWRLLIYPNSLVSRILKARYYPSSDFVDAQIGSNSSYIWRSILAGKALLREGVVRRVGDGKDTKIWGWPWLADSSTPMLHTPVAEELKDACVSGLLNESGAWDSEVVKDLFLDSDVNRILSTLVAPHIEDTWRWKGDIRGMYSVRHDYKLLMAETLHSDPQLQFIEWKKLWLLPVPPKVKNFLWRCMRDILPVRETLKRHVWAGGGFSFCSGALETMELCVPCGEPNMGSCCFVEWWQLGRNIKLCSPISSIDGDGAVSYAFVVYLSGHLTALNVNSNSWTPPPANKLKCNIDAAIFDDGAGFGMVMRDLEGKFVAAYARIDCGKDPLLAESMAVKEALTWLKYYIENVSVRHVIRSTNHVAHVLAQAADSLSVLGSWFSVPSICILHLVDY
ncbi:uncharacterized protein LOC116015819 [Ipomoea triloba]|uniref:uncharacterized protein LOC116015819 n=1 Tax=Ipomoea triloba TaxID=35885 RepID=UPI00125D9981|nr:uncharacterized protein LOC116015819 [Ipomoea triloba]